VRLLACASKDKKFANLNIEKQKVAISRKAKFLLNFTFSTKLLVFLLPIIKSHARLFEV
ncbi:unnamed protein product, partial [Musa textilis]